MRLAEYPDDIAFATAIGILPTPCAPSHEEHIPTRLMTEARLFRRLGLSKTLISTMLVRANQHGTTLESELLASGAVSEEIYYEALAEILRLPFLTRIDPSQLDDIPGADTQLVEPTAVRLRHSSRPPTTAIVPSAERLAYLTERLAHAPALRTMMAATTPSALRAALWQAGCNRRVRETVDQLFATMPEASARITLWGRQGFYTGAALMLLLALATAAPKLALILLHIVTTLLFFATFLVRLVALLAKKRQEGSTLTHPPARPRPVYSVFVALYREAAVVPQLVETLNKIEWPTARLDIKLICEADDQETLDALAAIRLGRQYEIVEVPPGRPRTKPKALSYALGAARGEYLVIYDAEDRVDPLQLEEAWRTFEAGPRDIACLQAPLVITNTRESWLSALFALEYAGLFRVLLPRLAAAGLPMPLGGTSNHFRTRVLQQVGGWDPFNVTEDADLGLRLYRLGYRCGTINRPTYEEAPSGRDCLARPAHALVQGLAANMAGADAAAHAAGAGYGPVAKLRLPGADRRAHPLLARASADHRLYRHDHLGTFLPVRLYGGTVRIDPFHHRHRQYLRKLRGLHRARPERHDARRTGGRRSALGADAGLLAVPLARGLACGARTVPRSVLLEQDGPSPGANRGRNGGGCRVVFTRPTIHSFVGYCGPSVQIATSTGASSRAPTRNIAPAAAGTVAGVAP